MRIINPTFGFAAVDKSASSSASTIDWLRDPIVVFGNNKPNAKELLFGVRAKLAEMRGVDDIDYLFKQNASRAAPAGMIDAVAQKYKVALLALAD